MDRYPRFSSAELNLWRPDSAYGIYADGKWKGQRGNSDWKKRANDFGDALFLKYRERDRQASLERLRGKSAGSSGTRSLRHGDIFREASRIAKDLFFLHLTVRETTAESLELLDRLESLCGFCCDRTEERAGNLEGDEWFDLPFEKNDCFFPLHAWLFSAAVFGFDESEKWREAAAREGMRLYPGADGSAQGAGENIEKAGSGAGEAVSRGTRAGDKITQSAEEGSDPGDRAGAGAEAGVVLELREGSGYNTSGGAKSGESCCREGITAGGRPAGEVYNFLRGTIIVPRHEAIPGVREAIEELGSLQESSGLWRGIAPPQAFNALSHSRLPEAVRQIEKALPAVLALRNPDGTWGSDEREKPLATFLMAHALSQRSNS